MSHTSGNILLHMIFSTNGRRPLIKPDFRTDLFAYLGGIVREMDGTAPIVNGTADHFHLLLRIRPAQSAAQIARVVKANSCRWVREKWSREFGWQTGYGVFSVSESNVPAVTKYIAEQEEHHRKHSQVHQRLMPGTLVLLGGTLRLASLRAGYKLKSCPSTLLSFPVSFPGSC